jgi:23S rRNA pseudouridine1911/1915/1917 synthase
MVTVNKNTVKQNYKIKGLDEIIVYSDMSPEETEVLPRKLILIFFMKMMM